MNKMQEAFERKYQMPWATAPDTIKEDFEAGYQTAITAVKAGCAVTINEHGKPVVISIQDDDGQIIEVLWEAKK